jgi:hypothetical protein
MERVEFTIGDLKRLIANAPDDGVIAISGSVVNGAQLVPGRVGEGYYNPNFREAAKGKVIGLVFTHWSEQSNGEVVVSKV